MNCRLVRYACRSRSSLSRPSRKSIPSTDANGLIMIKAPKGVKALFSDVNKVGKRIKASKKKFTWKFSVDSREHTIDMYVSSLSSKRKVLLDGDLVYSGKAQSGVYFHYPMKVDRVMVAIEQMEDSWDLKIGGVSFAQLAVMRQSAPDSKEADWGAAQEWKADKESEFGPVHNKWDDWEKPKPKPKAAEEWEDPRGKASWGEEEEREESWNRRRPENWEEREVRPKPAARPAEDYDWDTKGFPQDEEDYPPRRDPRETRPQRREPPRDEYLRRDDERYRRDEEHYRAKPREEDRRRREEERYREERLPPRRPSPERETDYEFRSRPADPPRKPPREDYEKPRQPEFDPFEIHDNPPPARKTYYEEEEEEENLYPSLSSLDAKRQSQQPAFPPYQAPPPATDSYATPAVDSYSARPADPYSARAVDPFSNPAADPFSNPAADPFSHPAANVFESQPLQTPAEFKVTSSRPFEDPFSAPPPPKKAEPDISHLVDLDGLNLGDDYSPAVARKREEQNRAVSVGVAAPNVPMNQLKPSQPGAPNPMMTAPMMPNPMMQNPMAAAMMMQSYMTNMMMNSMMMNQGGAPQQRYF